MLIEVGADIKALNQNGLNCLHVAAQGDHAGAIYFFSKVHGLDLK